MSERERRTHFRKLEKADAEAEAAEVEEAPPVDDEMEE